MRFIVCHISFLAIVLTTSIAAGYSQVITESLLPPAIESSVDIDMPAENKYRFSKPFSFATHVPGNIAQLARTPFLKKSIKPLTIIGGSTAVLFFLDEAIIKGAGKTFRRLGVEQQENFSHRLRIGKADIIKIPGNINSFFYYLGEPGPTFLLASGFYLYGKISHSIRVIRTASEITESFITTLITVQTLKRITGRQSPNKATVQGGKWHWFPSLSEYNKNVTNYIAYPSGHMATMMSVVTVIAENYPEKKWIKPIGYTLTGLTALSMLNNKVHWASDFPLGLAIGYISAKIAHHRNQKNERIKKTLPL